MLKMIVIGAWISLVETPTASEPLLTVAERSEFHATARYDETVELCRELDRRSDIITLSELGRSHEGRSLPLLILADPPVSTPEQARESGKIVVFAFGNIHAGEVCGKEALLMLARELSERKNDPIWDDLIIALAPIYNADGNDKMAKDNRPGQNGPDEMGERHNAQGLDLNRDYVKLEAPETRALNRFLNTWDPAMIIDTHTTNGSYHQYALTYAGPRSLTGDTRVMDYVNQTLLPEISKRLEARSGYKSFFYGDFNRDKTAWVTPYYPPVPRFGTPYRGMRNRLAILSEAYAYAPFQDRVLVTRDFVRLCFEYAGENAKEIKKLLRQVDNDATAAGREPNDEVVLRTNLVAFDSKITIPGYVEVVDEATGRSKPTDEKRDYVVDFIGRPVPELSVKRPYAYVFPASYSNVAKNLQYHGIDVEELHEDIELDVEIYRVDKIDRADQVWQNHRLARNVETSARTRTRRFEAGSYCVRTAQPLGSLLVYLLEPQSEDGLCAWNFFDGGLKAGEDFPACRLMTPTPMETGAVRPLQEYRTFHKPITYEMAYGRQGPSFNGSPVSTQGWLDDEYYLQVRDRRLYKVHAATGRSEPFHDPDLMAGALQKLEGINARRATEWAESSRFDMDPRRQGALFSHERDLYYATFDGARAVRLTHTPGQREEQEEFSPDGRWVAFVRDQDLYAVDLETQTERTLTADGGDRIFNGKADWVYYEEIFGRSYKAFWWSPDSSALAYLRFDDTPLDTFILVDHDPVKQRIEETRYPKAGEANPHVQVGVVGIADGKTHWADLGEADPNEIVISGVGWMSDGRNAYFYLQDRAQTWLDFMTVSREDGSTRKLFRDQTEAWIESPGDPRFLKDGSFLISSERSGWKHLYHYGADGELLHPVTSGEWEVRQIHVLDEEGGWIHVSGTKDSHIAENLYRVRLDGSSAERLTREAGSHRVSVSPGGKYYIDSRSSHDAPERVSLFDAGGTLVRRLDVNPVYSREEYEISPVEMIQIEARDGFILEAMMIKPPDFDPHRKYPVWFMTYAGPHAPTVRDAWGGGRPRDQYLAREGLIVFYCDPRSASGKGAVSAWSAYKQLGVREMKDIEDAIRYLGELPYVDAARVGMSGYSYGGYMTAYAMTHGDLFRCGIAGAPVTDWRLYDTIYTERYMDTPRRNAEGYKKSSVLEAAANLHGRLLLVHGTMDDNVHLQNTVRLSDALIKADKQFELMIYPGFRHGIWAPHFNRLTVDFIKRNLLRPETEFADELATPATGRNDDGSTRAH